VAGIAGIYPVFDLRSYPGLANAVPAYGISSDETQIDLQVDPKSCLHRIGSPSNAHSKPDILLE
jgi:hypothetical protein